MVLGVFFTFRPTPKWVASFIVGFFARSMSPIPPYPTVEAPEHCSRANKSTPSQGFQWATCGWRLNPQSITSSSTPAQHSAHCHHGGVGVYIQEAGWRPCVTGVQEGGLVGFHRPRPKVFPSSPRPLWPVSPKHSGCSFRSFSCERVRLVLFRPWRDSVWGNTCCEKPIRSAVHVRHSIWLHSCSTI